LTAAIKSFYKKNPKDDNTITISILFEKALEAYVREKSNSAVVR